jgi:hypothetical protein
MMAGLRIKTLVLAAVLGVGMVVGAAGLAGCGSSDLDERGQLIRTTAEYLWKQQDEDGGWHSETHGLLRGGETWTPFVAHYLFQIPDSIFAAPEGGRERALQFIREHTADAGILGISDPTVLEYPNYATSYALRVLKRWGAPPDSTLIRKMAQYLHGQQYDELRGIGAEHPAYGAWGFGETSLPVGQVGHIDLSHTRRVLEALASTGARGEHDMKVQRFLAMLQKHPSDTRPQPGANQGDRHPPYDGGFYASTVTVGLNKGGAVTDSLGLSYYPSYSTTTCDGVLTLLAAGVPADDERVRRAAEWLSMHTDLTVVQGIPENPSQWQHVMFYYHLLVRSEANTALGIGGTWPDDMLALLAERQRPDGSFSNPAGAPNKEDDPILATTMVVGTLLNAH